jgi:phenylpropionate dioxygenase-like ring-hydroxylating dioxygenase large terminal subunit
MDYSRNVWYVAAWSSEVTRTLFTRTVCDEPILAFRKENGEAVALSNRCPHRFAPLNRGKLIADDCIQCPYHGLEFDASGKCVRNPHGDNKIPQAAKLRHFPLVERHSLIWLWFGDPAQATPDTIPDFHFLDSSEFKTVAGILTVDGNYELYTDNLMDLSHVEFLHAGGLGSEAMKRGDHSVRQEGLTVHSDRWCPNGLAPPVWDAMFDNYGKPVDLWMYMRWDAPAHMALDVGISPTGTNREAGIWVWGTDIITPETSRTSHYFWALSRTYKRDDSTVDEGWRKSIEIAFHDEDARMIGAVQQMMGDCSLEELSPVLLQPDAGAMRVRRILRQLIAKEKSTALGTTISAK